MLPKRLFPWLSAGFLLALLWLAAATPTTFAHGSTTVGPYNLVVGWVNEPPLVGERNALLLIVTEAATGEPVVGVEATLDAEVIYGAKTFSGNLNPSTIPGEYTLDLIPTVRGQFNLRLSGTIGETAVELTTEPEEVFAAARLQFPEALPDALALNQQITTLTTELQQARTLAFVAIGIGVVGFGLGLVSLLRKK
jgi:hypothetical protein